MIILLGQRGNRSARARKALKLSSQFLAAGMSDCARLY